MDEDFTQDEIMLFVSATLAMLEITLPIEHAA